VVETSKRFAPNGNRTLVVQSVGIYFNGCVLFEGYHVWILTCVRTVQAEILMIFPNRFRRMLGMYQNYSSSIFVPHPNWRYGSIYSFLEFSSFETEKLVVVSHRRITFFPFWTVIPKVRTQSYFIFSERTVILNVINLWVILKRLLCRTKVMLGEGYLVTPRWEGPSVMNWYSSECWLHWLTLRAIKVLWWRNQKTYGH